MGFLSWAPDDLAKLPAMGVAEGMLERCKDLGVGSRS